MPKNKSEKINNQQNMSSTLEPAVTLKPDKAEEYPPSLNNIDKNHP